MKINVDIDEKITEFVNKETGENVDNLTNIIHDIVKYVLLEQNICVDFVDVSIQSVTEQEIKEINGKYRNIDRVTDVLSFPIFTKEEFKKLDKNNIKEMELGDIFLCLDVIKRQSVEYGTGILREVLYMITHGMCHLTGHDHEVEEEKRKMRALEEKVLSKVGVGKIDE